MYERYTEDVHFSDDSRPTDKVIEDIVDGAFASYLVKILDYLPIPMSFPYELRKAFEEKVAKYMKNNSFEFKNYTRQQTIEKMRFWTTKQFCSHDIGNFIELMGSEL